MTTSTHRTSLSAAIRSMGYEVLPFAGTFEKVLAHVPSSIPLTVTASPQKGITATVDLAVQLTGAGYSVAPHLSARMVSDRSQLADLLDRLVDSGIQRLFIVGGDGEPAGDFSDALGLIRAVRESGRSFASVGIGGYPEGHAVIDDRALLLALREKAEYADHITTQICFNAATIARWAETLRAEGVDLPLHIGMPGSVSRQKLLRITSSIGIGDSAKFLRRQSTLFWRFFLPGGYRPDRLVRDLAPALTSDSAVSGFHIFTFNDLEGTQRWRSRMLERISENS